MKYYAGIGSRQSPQPVLDLIVLIAGRLKNLSWILRSGGAQGADSAFEHGAFASCNTEIFHAVHATPAAIEMAANYHPAWDKCGQYARQLHGRNAMIILGPTLRTPVKFVICWTPRGELSGGTAMGIRIAEDFGIPVYNLGNSEHYARLAKFIYPEGIELCSDF